MSRSSPARNGDERAHPSLYRRLARKLRWWAGAGWSADDFDDRYAAKEADAWGYDHSPAHLHRRAMIISALPDGPIACALEVGCAEGFVSRVLAGRVEQLVGCDVSEEAVRRAHAGCRDLANVRFEVVDIRRGFPTGDLQLCVFSDVLYYLSRGEIEQVLDEAARRVVNSGWLVFANEWQPGYKGLTPPGVVLDILDAMPDWSRVRVQASPIADETTLTVALYQRT